MERAIKQRILGALVLAAGCAILVPVVLDGSGTLHQWREVPLPPRPSLPAPTTAQLPWTPPPAVAALPAPAPIMPPIAPPIAPLPVTTPATAAVAPLLHPAAPLQAMVSKTPPVRAVVVPKVAVLAPLTTPAPVAAPAQTDPVDMLPDMWTVQVASLTSEAAANSFKHQLEQAHQHVYTRHVGKAYKVYVGPELSRTQAEKTKQTLHAQGLQGWLQPYVVQ